MKKFSQKEKDQIARAIEDFEKKTSGEIVPYYVKACDSYEETQWQTATGGAVFGVVTLLSLWYLWIYPDWLDPVFISLYFLVLMIVGYFLPFLFPGLRRTLAGENKMNMLVQEEAFAAFAREGIYETTRRNGILIFISHLEHKVVIIGDKGINEKVKQEEWDKILENLVNHIKQDKITHGIVESIGLCGELLIEHGFVGGKDDPDELPNRFRTED